MAPNTSNSDPVTNSTIRTHRLQTQPKPAIRKQPPKRAHTSNVCTSCMTSFPVTAPNNIIRVFSYMPIRKRAVTSQSPSLSQLDDRMTAQSALSYPPLHKDSKFVILSDW
ncbi:hypothetical protein B0J17DRAFT_35420 [Rhizoctonia solani]|nr:hypothetical protein B0J17DRAFT_35420 [Rhizoctonia solani]